MLNSDVLLSFRLQFFLYFWNLIIYSAFNLNRFWFNFLTDVFNYFWLMILFNWNFFFLFLSNFFRILKLQFRRHGVDGDINHLIIFFWFLNWFDFLFDFSYLNLYNFFLNLDCWRILFNFNFSLFLDLLYFDLNFFNLNFFDWYLFFLILDEGGTLTLSFLFSLDFQRLNTCRKYLINLCIISNSISEILQTNPKDEITREP